MAAPSVPARAAVIEPSYFSNWGDLWYPRLAHRLLGPASRVRWLTPNIVTGTAFALTLAACGLAVAGGRMWLLAALLLPAGYVLDCLDGQLARATGRGTALGDYLDKTLDVLKVGLLTLAMALAAASGGHETRYLLLAFASVFGFLFRYYIKLETMFGAMQRDPAYLVRSRERRLELYALLDARRAAPMDASARLRWLWLRNRSLLALDEAEHVTLAAVALLAGHPELWVWTFGVGQPAIALVRLVGRGRQVAGDPARLLDPLRK